MIQYDWEVWPIVLDPNTTLNVFQKSVSNRGITKSAFLKLKLLFCLHWLIEHKENQPVDAISLKQAPQEFCLPS